MGLWDEISAGFDEFVSDIGLDDVVDFVTGIGDAPPVNGNRLPAQDGAGNVVSNGGGGIAPGCSVTTAMSMRQVAACPPGYVAVDTNGDGITDTCMIKEVARACKLWKARPKPLLTASDRRTLNRATSVMRRVDNVVKQTNTLRGQAKLTKSRPTSRK